MAWDTKSETKKLASDVSDSADAVRKGFEDAVKAATKLDKSYSDLSKTQQAAYKVAVKFGDAIEKCNKRQLDFSKANAKTAKNLGLVAGSMSKVERRATAAFNQMNAVIAAVKKLSGKDVGIDVEIDGLKQLINLEKRIAKLPRRVKVEIETKGGAGGGRGKGGGGGGGGGGSGAGAAKATEVISEFLKDVKYQLDGIGDDIDDVVSRDRYIEVKVEVSRAEELQKLINSLGQVEKDAFLAATAGKNFEGVLAHALAMSGKKATAFRKQFAKIPKDVEKAVAKIGKKFNLSKIIKRETKLSASALKKLEKKVSATAIEQKVTLAVDTASLKTFEEYVDAMEEGEEKTQLLDKASVDLRGCIKDLAKTNVEFAEKLEDVQGEAAKTAASARTMAEEFNKARGVMDLVKKEYISGRAAAEDFAGGVGVGNGMMIGAGAAAFFLLDKIGGLIGEFEEGALALARWNADADAFAATVYGISNGALWSMRDELNLTREQATAFYDTVREGTNTLGLTQQELMKTAKALQSTFGGDQTARLKEYIGLLQMIPTMDTDLKITSSLDDESAAIFGLAKSGKIEAVIDLQAAGLLGAGAPIKMTSDDAALINASQKTKKGVEDIYDAMRSYYPSWGPQFAAIADNTFKALGFLGGAVALWGTMRVFFGSKQDKTTRAVENNTREIVTAIRMSSGKSGRGRGPRGRIFKDFFKSPMKSIKRAPQRLLLKIGGKDLAKQVGAKLSGPLMSKLGASLGKFVKAGGIYAAVTLAAGLAADKLGDMMDSAGYKTGAAMAKVTGGLLKMAGTIWSFAAIGSMFGPWGTAIGAAVGIVVASLDVLPGAFEAAGNAFTKQVNVGGKMIAKYGKAGQAFGNALLGISETLNTVKEGFKEMAGAIWGGVKWFVKITNPIAWAIKAFQALDEAMQSDEYKAAMAEATRGVNVLTAQFERMKGNADRFDKSLADNRKRTMKSGLALQMEMKRLESEVKSAKFELVDFQKGIADLRLENLSEIGGSAEAFSNAIAAATSATTRRFDMMNDTLEKARKRAASNANLTGEQRRQQLLNLHKQELEAAKMFVTDMRKVIDALLKSPAIIKAGLSREIKTTKLDMQIEAGSISVEKALGDASSAADDTNKSFSSTADALSKGTQKLIDMEEKMTEQRGKAAKALEDELSGVDPAKIKSLGLEGMVEKTATGYKVAAGKEAEALEAVQKKTDTLTDSLTTLRDSIPDGSFFSLSSEMEKTAEKEKELEKRMAETAKKREEVGKGAWAKAKGAVGMGPDVTAEQKKLDDDMEQIQKERAQAFEAQSKTQEQVRKMMEDALGKEKAAAVNVASIAEKLPALAVAIQQGKQEEARDMLKELNDTESISKVLTLLDKEHVKHFNTLAKIKDTTGKLTEVANVSGPLTSLMDANNAEIQQQEVILEQQKALANLVQDSATNAEIMAKVLETGLPEQLRRQSEALSLQVTLAGQTGDSSVQLAELMGDEVKLATARAEALDKAMVEGEKTVISQKQLVESAKLSLAKAEEANRAGVKGGEKLVENAKNILDGANAALSTTEKSVSAWKKQRADIVAELGMVGDSISKALEEFEKTFEGRRITAQLDLSDTLAEFAEFSNNMVGDAAEATKIATAAAKERMDVQRKYINDSIEAEKDRVEALAKAAEKKGGPKEGERVRREGMATLEAKKRNDLAKIEVDYKRKVLEAARREADLRTEDVNIRQEMIDAESDFLSEIGGDFGTILKLQQQSVSMEAEKLAILEDQLAKARAIDKDSLQTKRLERDVFIQELAVQKKALGAQKSVFDKIMGAAFGQLRASAGIRKFQTSDVTKLGIEGTRGKTRAGIYTGAPAGGAGTIAQRAARMQGAVAAGKARGGASANIEPKRLAIEKQMADEMGENKDYTKDTSASTRGLLDTFDKVGSGYTHDVTAEGLLKQILAVNEAMAESMVDAQRFTTTEMRMSPVNALQKKLEEIRKSSAAMTSAVEVAKESPTATMATESMVTAQEQASDTTSDVVSAQKKGLQTGKQKARLEKREIATFKKGAEISKSLGIGALGSKDTAEALEMGADSLSVEADSANAAKEKARRDDFVRRHTIGGGAAATGANLPTAAEAASASAAKAGATDTSVALGRNFASTTGTAVGAGPSGGGGTGAMAEMPVMKVKGEMTVHFDSQMFKQELVPVIGEVINTQQIVRMLVRAGFINRNA